MQPHTIWALAATALLGHGLPAQGIAGTWQGIVSVGNATFRNVFKFTSSAAGWKTVYYSLEEVTDSVEATSAVLEGRSLKVVFPKYFGSSTGATYEGTLAQDGQSLTGSGRPLVFLSGLGGSAHEFDTFAPDAAMWYAFYDGSVGELAFDRADLIRQLQQLRPERMTPSELRALIRSLRDTTLPRFEKDLDQSANRLNTLPAPKTAPDTTATASRAIFDGMQEYTHIPVPILAIYAMPLEIYPTPGSDSATQARTWAQTDSMKFAQATAFEHGVPTARVVGIPNSTHYVFQSNEADVPREMNAFLSTVGP